MSSSFAPDTTVATLPGLSVADLGDEAVMLDPASGRYFGLNGVATRILDMVRQPMPVSSIKETLAIEYEVERDQLDEDVDGFLSMLISRGLIHVVD